MRPRRFLLSDSPTVVATHNPDLQHHFSSMEQQQDASMLGMWVFLITEIMFFGGMFFGYMVYRFYYYAAWLEGSQHMEFWWGSTTQASQPVPASALWPAL